MTDNPERALFEKVKYRSVTNRGYTWDLTVAEFNRLTALPCYYCGEPPSQVYRRRIRKSRSNPEKYEVTGLTELIMIKATRSRIVFLVVGAVTLLKELDQ